MCQLLFSRRLKEKNWRKLEQHSTENHRKIPDQLECVTSKHEVMVSNLDGETFSFSKLFAYMFFLCQLSLALQAHFGMGLKRN